MSFQSVLREGIMGIVNDEEQTDMIMAVCESVARSAAGAERTAAMFEASDGKGKSYETLKDMAMWLLVESNALNVIHWNVDRNSKHELLNEAYDLCRDTGDKLAEAYIAIVDRPIDIRKAPALPSTDTKDAAVLEHLKNLQKRMQEAVEKNPKFSEGVKNIFADFDEQITTIIYKWARFSA